ncbi:MAG: hypothetical protein GX258_01495 [Clostridiales bacterium]|nr:hypothetical protein [Clostridiales bacterium]
MSFKRLSKPERWIVVGIPLIFIMGSLGHFIYEWSGKNLLLALFFPVNESVWEHIKLGNIPIILWWGFYYFINSRKYNLDKDKWFTAELAALAVSMITTPALYYLYTGAFGAENLIVDILIFFLAILFAQLLGLHFYRYYKGINSGIVIVINILIILIFVIFTIYPPNLPIFISSN